MVLEIAKKLKIHFLKKILERCRVYDIGMDSHGNLVDANIDNEENSV